MQCVCSVQCQGSVKLCYISPVVFILLIKHWVTSLEVFGLTVIRVSFHGTGGRSSLIIPETSSREVFIILTTGQFALMDYGRIRKIHILAVTF